MTLGSFLVLLAVFVALAIAIVFICNNGGWQGGCGGNCAACRHRCADAARKDPNDPDAARRTAAAERRAGFLCLQPRASAVTSARMARIWSGSVPVSCQV